MSVELLVRKMSLRDALSPAEVEALERLPGTTAHYRRHQKIVREGEPQTRSRLLLDGWVARVKTVADGRRQITQLHVPGDFVDLHSFLLKVLDHDIIALTPAVISDVDHDRLARITETQPHLTRMLWLSTMIDAAIHREALTLMGRGSAAEHLAHLLCELYVRLQGIGHADQDRFELPLAQEELGDVCGLTPVHVNRVMQELCGQGLVVTKGRTVTLPDFAALARFGQFDPTYLNLQREPR